MKANNNPSILIVEDEPFVLMLLEEFLGDLDYEIVSAVDAKTALRIIASRPEISLLLTDVGLPEMNGWALAKAVRDLRPSLPIIFATGYGDNSDADHQAHEHGAAIAPKPFNMDRLAELVRAMIGGDEA